MTTTLPPSGPTDPPADHLFYPPRASRGTRGPFKPNRGSSRARIVGGTIPTVMYMESGLEKKAVYCMLADLALRHTGLVAGIRPPARALEPAPGAGAIHQGCGSAADLDVVDVQEQPPAIDYVDVDGKTVSYTWDARVTLRCGTRILVAIKPAKIALKLGLRQTIERYAAQTPRSVADKAVLITGEKLPRDLVHDALLIHSVRRDPDSPADDAVRHFVNGLAGSVTIGTIVRATGAGAAAFRAAVRLIAEGTLSVVGPGRITYSTRVSARSSIPGRAA